VADDKLAAALAEIRAADSSPVLALLSEAARAARKGYAPWFAEEEIDAADNAVTALDLARGCLLGAVEAALACHQRTALYGNAATDDEPDACPHDPDDALHFEDADEPGEWLCEGKPEGAVCSSCVDGEGGERMEWPCPEYSAILAALTGKGGER
jgi:hypothetical protein